MQFLEYLLTLLRQTIELFLKFVQLSHCLRPPKVKACLQKLTVLDLLSLVLVSSVDLVFDHYNSNLIPKPWTTRRLLTDFRNYLGMPTRKTKLKLSYVSILVASSGGVRLELEPLPPEATLLNYYNT
jgi:hypothetical protein